MMTTNLTPAVHRCNKRGRVARWGQLCRNAADNAENWLPNPAWFIISSVIVSGVFVLYRPPSELNLLAALGG